MPLIKQIREAVENGNLKQPFTVEALKQWIKKNHIVKDDGGEYAKSSINAILSNSDIKNTPTTNKNIKPLKSKKNDNGKYDYWLINVNYYSRSTTIIIPVYVASLENLTKMVLERQRKQKEPVGRLAFPLPRKHFMYATA